MTRKIKDIKRIVIKSKFHGSLSDEGAALERHKSLDVVWINIHVA